jgi:DHA1 family bicyclomycin/chloramphenicol resistance-like MFS transporter
LDATPSRPAATGGTRKDAPISARPLLALLMAMTAIGPLSLNILVPATPGLVSKLSTDTATVQLTVSLYLLGLAVSQLALGPLSDRFGRRPVVLCGLAITVVSSFLAILAASIGSLIAVRTLQAFGASTGIVIGRAIIRDLYDRERAASMIGWVTTVMVVAPMVSPLIGGLLDTAFGWETTFVFVGVCALIVLSWTWWTLPETRPARAGNGGLRALAGDCGALLRARDFNAYVVAAALGSATFFAFLGGSPHVVIEVMGQSSAAYGAWFILSSLGYMAGNLCAARFSPRLGVDRMIRLGLATEVLGAALVALWVWLSPRGGPATIFVSQVIISFGIGVALPNAIAGAVSVRPQAAGTASGITGFAQMTIAALTAQATSWLVAGSTTAMELAIVILMIALFAMLGYMALKRPTSAPT